MIETIGRYEIIEKLGQGGFAIVYRARDTQLGREVALKELRPLLLNDTGWVRRFRREARAIAALDHPHIVPIYDVYEAENRLFLVMRLVNGPSLDHLISAQRHIPWATTLENLAQIAGGLDYAHSQGILHRDLKPANILLDVDRGPLLTDFGLAKLAGENSLSLSASNNIVGTPHYIAPEVWEGKGSSPQSDIYALGCILFEMITGDKVFKGTTPPVVMMAHFQPLTLPEVWPADVPPGIASVFQKALATQPTERYNSANELVAALKSLAEPARPISPPAVAAAGPTPQQKERLQAQAEVSVEPPDLPALDAGEFDDEDRREAWRGFLAHLGPYVMVIGGLGVINLLTGGGYPWFLWPAIGWGIGLAFHLWSILSDSVLQTQGKWNDLVNHLASYVIIIGALGAMNLLTSGYPWFLWPAMIWGIALAIHIWHTLVSPEKDSAVRAIDKERKRWKRAQRKEWRRWKKQRRATQPAAGFSPPELASDSLQAHLLKARAYQQQIDELIKGNTNRAFQPHLQDMARQVDDWVKAIEALVKRVDQFQRNDIIRHDLESVPRFIEKLEARLATETDPATRADLQRTLENRQTQLAALTHLQRTMKRAEIKIERTLSALGTLYPQILTGQSTNHVADYSRITSEVSEEVRTLKDHLEALEEVKFGQSPQADERIAANE